MIKPKLTAKPCKHRRCWVICGGLKLWCYECGALGTAG